MEFTKNQEIWVKLPWVDSEMAVQGTFIAETAKRYKVYCDMRGGVIYVAKHNVIPREAAQAASQPARRRR
jgi:hypothetical protein